MLSLVILFHTTLSVPQPGKAPTVEGVARLTGLCRCAVGVPVLRVAGTLPPLACTVHRAECSMQGWGTGCNEVYPPGDSAEGVG